MNISFRTPTLDDLDILLEHINAASKEETFIRKQGMQLSKKDEESFLKKVTKDYKNKKGIMLLAFVDDELAGTADIYAGIGAEKHTGIFGIIIKKKFRNQGIGTKLMKEVIEQAIEHLDDLEIITLGVFAKNERGVHIYKKFGFKEFGRLPKGVLRKNQYDDHINMYLRVEDYEKK